MGTAATLLSCRDVTSGSSNSIENDAAFDDSHFLCTFEIQTGGEGGAFDYMDESSGSDSTRDCHLPFETGEHLVVSGPLTNASANACSPEWPPRYLQLCRAIFRSASNESADRKRLHISLMAEKYAVLVYGVIFIIM